MSKETAKQLQDRLLSQLSQVPFAVAEGLLREVSYARIVRNLTSLKKQGKVGYARYSTPSENKRGGVAPRGCWFLIREERVDIGKLEVIIETAETYEGTMWDFNSNFRWSGASHGLNFQFWSKERRTAITAFLAYVKSLNVTGTFSIVKEFSR